MVPAAAVCVPASSTRLPAQAARGFDIPPVPWPVQAPEHDIENARLLAKAQAKFGDDTKHINQSLSPSARPRRASWAGRRRLSTSWWPPPGAADFLLRHHPLMLLNLMHRLEPGHCRLPHHSNNHEPQRRRELLRKAIGIWLGRAADRWRGLSEPTPGTSTAPTPA